MIPYFQAFIEPILIISLILRLFTQQFIYSGFPGFNSQVTVRPFELDGYNSVVKVATEHLDSQHIGSVQKIDDVREHRSLGQYRRVEHLFHFSFNLI